MYILTDYDSYDHLTNQLLNASTENLALDWSKPGASEPSSFYKREYGACLPL